MKTLKLIAALSLGALVSACGGVDIASRNASFDATAPALSFQQDIAPITAPVVRVARINVVVPETLKVSEANRYYPSGDIVWREDPIGNRHAQVKAIFENAMALGTQNMDGATPVVLDIQVMRFHALTEKARYTVGGVHSITFFLTVRDAKTGLALAAPRKIEADLDGFGGQQAINAESRGQTQKVRITGHLAEVIRQELSTPGGYHNARLGLMQQINKI
jgi:hypothetical protein